MTPTSAWARFAGPPYEMNSRRFKVPLALPLVSDGHAAGRVGKCTSCPRVRLVIQGKSTLTATSAWARFTGPPYEMHSRRSMAPSGFALVAGPQPSGRVGKCPSCPRVRFVIQGKSTLTATSAWARFAGPPYAMNSCRSMAPSGFALVAGPQPYGRVGKCTSCPRVRLLIQGKSTLTPISAWARFAGPPYEMHSRRSMAPSGFALVAGPQPSGRVGKCPSCPRVFAIN